MGTARRIEVKRLILIRLELELAALKKQIAFQKKELRKLHAQDKTKKELA